MKVSAAFKRTLNWFWVGAWILVIYLTLPYAPVWGTWLVDRFSDNFFPVFVASVLVVIFILTIISLIKNKAFLWQYIVFILVAAGYWYSLVQIKIPIEQVHFLEYGLLAALIIKAFRFDHQDIPQFFKTIMLVTLVGVVDELIQGNGLPWFQVNRVGELRDVKLNILAGALALIWYRYCLNVKIDERSDWLRAVRFSLPVLGAIILVIGIFNSRISGFGYYIRDKDIGAFYSRLTPEQLLNDPPAVEVFQQQILPRLFRDRYSDILQEAQTPLHTEVLVHLFRRYKRLKDDQDYLTAYRENQILEKYFRPYIENTDYRWDENLTQKVFRAAESDMLKRYISPVAEHLIVSFAERTQWIVLIISEVSLVVIFMSLGIKQKS